jgi:HSP20 family protein
MAREREQAEQNQQSGQGAQSQGSRSQGSQSQGAQPQGSQSQGSSNANDQERSIQTSREGNRGGQSVQGGQATQSGQGVQGGRGGQGMQRSPMGFTSRRSPFMYDRNEAFSNPFALMQRMTEDMDHLFDQLGFGGGLRPSSSLGMPGNRGMLGTRGGQGLSRMSGDMWMPQIETSRRGDRFVVRADVPGVKKEDLQIDVEDGVLTLSGERREENTEDRDGFYRSERSYGRFQRAIPIPEGIETDACEATFRDGVLEISLPMPKNEEAKQRRIEIR